MELARQCQIDYVLCFQIRPVELTSVSDLRSRDPDTCGHLIASSPIVHVNLPNRKLGKPITVSIPVPPNTQKRSRPHTAVERKDRSGGGGGPKPRPVSALLSHSKEGNVNKRI